jgi:molybdenum cofactor synthesis domain-containing protein
MSIRMHGFTRYVRLADALKIVLSKAKPLESEAVPFDRAFGRVLAEDIVSEIDVPPFDRSAVDGYAVRAADTFGASELKPVNLRIIGSVNIGVASKIPVKKGETVKIMTGASLPKGSDAVVMVEHTRANGKGIAVLAPVTPGKNVSEKGEDVKAGEAVLEGGCLLRPQDVGMIASMGKTLVRVSRRPEVAILATGSELREPGESLGRAEITDINSYSLAAAAEKVGALPHRLGIVPDNSEKLERALRKAISYDMVLASGGSSVGEHDIVPDVIAELGELVFHGVAIRPGAPTAFGVIKNKSIFALPGFPVSSLIAFDMLVGPALRQMQGLPADRGYPKVRARLARKVSSTLGRADIVRVRIVPRESGFVADPLRVTGSSVLSSMTKADGFVIVPENVEGFDEGKIVEVELYR